MEFLARIIPIQSFHGLKDFSYTYRNWINVFLIKLTKINIREFWNSISFRIRTVLTPRSNLLEIDDTTLAQWSATTSSSDAHTFTQRSPFILLRFEGKIRFCPPHYKRLFIHCNAMRLKLMHFKWWSTKFNEILYSHHCCEAADFSVIKVLFTESNVFIFVN